MNSIMLKAMLTELSMMPPLSVTIFTFVPLIFSVRVNEGNVGNTKLIIEIIRIVLVKKKNAFKY